MANWFECKYKFNKEDSQVGFKSTTETVLMDAVSWSEAETRVYAELASNLRDFKLMKVGEYKVQDIVFNEEAEKWYRCKVSMVTVDEKSGREKKVKQIVLVAANDIKAANESINDLFSTALSNFTSVEIKETNIVEVMPYFGEERQESGVVDSSDSNGIMNTNQTSILDEIPADSEYDPLLKEAAYLCVEEKQGSTALIQRRLSLGYNRAGRIMDQMEQLKIVSEFDGHKAREILVSNRELVDILNNI